MSIKSRNIIKVDNGSTSMTDLVFLLLLFFIILSALAKNAVDVNLPKGGMSSTSANAKASVVITAENLIKLNGVIVQEEMIENEILNAISEDDKRVELYADDKADYGKAVKIIDIAKKNNLDILLMTQK